MKSSSLPKTPKDAKQSVSFVAGVKLGQKENQPPSPADSVKTCGTNASTSSAVIASRYNSEKISGYNKKIEKATKRVNVLKLEQALAPSIIENRKQAKLKTFQASEQSKLQIRLKNLRRPQSIKQGLTANITGIESIRSDAIEKLESTRDASKLAATTKRDITIKEAEAVIEKARADCKLEEEAADAEFSREKEVVDSEFEARKAKLSTKTDKTAGRAQADREKAEAKMTTAVANYEEKLNQDSRSTLADLIETLGKELNNKVVELHVLKEDCAEALGIEIYELSDIGVVFDGGNATLWVDKYASFPNKCPLPDIMEGTSALIKEAFYPQIAFDTRPDFSTITKADAHAYAGATKLSEVKLWGSEKCRQLLVDMNGPALEISATKVIHPYSWKHNQEFHKICDNIVASSGEASDPNFFTHAFYYFCGTEDFKASGSPRHMLTAVPRGPKSTQAFVALVLGMDIDCNIWAFVDYPVGK